MTIARTRVLRKAYLSFPLNAFSVIQCFLSLMAMCWWPSIRNLEISQEGYKVRSKPFCCLILDP